MHDVAIIGAGVTGCAQAYTLSSYEISVLLLEKENDVAMGATRANTAIIHAGFAPEPHSIMGKLNVEGNRACYALCEALDVEHRRTGSWVVAFDKEQRDALDVLHQQGIENGCKGLEIVSGDEARKREPNLSSEIIGALWAPEAGVINPWEFALAMAEVAVRNGVRFMPNTEVTGITGASDHYDIETTEGHYRARYVVNAAGVESDSIHNMVAGPAFHIVPTRGEYYLLDRSIGTLVKSIVFQSPTSAGKGITVSPTIHDNFLIGPNSEKIDDPQDTSVTRLALDEIREAARHLVPSLDTRASIRNFAGVRANSDINDFYIAFTAPGFLDLAAIKSPGLTSAPAIARLAKDMLKAEGLSLSQKAHWKGGRQVIRFKEIPEEERKAFVKNNPLYGRVICRCETITEGEIVAALKREIPPVSIDGVKRRAGTGMGRCQGGFCGPRVLEIIAREQKRDPLTIEEDARGSQVLTGTTKREDCAHA